MYPPKIKKRLCKIILKDYTILYLFLQVQIIAKYKKKGVTSTPLRLFVF